MSVHYLKIEVTKYICSHLRIIKIAGQIQPSCDLIMEYASNNAYFISLKKCVGRKYYLKMNELLSNFDQIK